MRFPDLRMGGTASLVLLIVDHHAAVQLETLCICGTYGTWLNYGPMRVYHGSHLNWVENTWPDAQLGHGLVQRILFRFVVGPVLMTSFPPSEGLLFMLLLTVRPSSPSRDILEGHHTCRLAMQASRTYHWKWLQRSVRAPIRLDLVERQRLKIHLWPLLLLLRDWRVKVNPIIIAFSDAIRLVHFLLFCMRTIYR